MKYEKPQKGNPHQITVMQHTFPRASIARFADNSGRVKVSHMPTQKTLSLAPNDSLFCAKRVWDQRAEEGYMKNIEDNFQALASAIVERKVRNIGIIENIIVSEFFALWNIRVHIKSNPISDQKINGIIELKHELTKDQQEILERKHVGFVRPDLTIPGRQLADLNIQMNLDKVRQQLADAKWGILKASEGEFIAPDNFSNARVVPISPSVCLFSQSESDVISKSEVSEINRLAISSSIDYFFARDFSKCPI